MFWGRELDTEQQEKVDRLTKEGFQMYSALQALNVNLEELILIIDS